MRSRARACAGTRGTPTIPDRGQLAIRSRRERIPINRGSGTVEAFGAATVRNSSAANGRQERRLRSVPTETQRRELLDSALEQRLIIVGHSECAERKGLEVGREEKRVCLLLDFRGAPERDTPL